MFIDSIKGGLYDQLLSSIDKEFVAESLMPPPADSELLKVWYGRVAHAINNKIITWEEFFAMFPPDYSDALKEALVRLSCDKEK